MDIATAVLMTVIVHVCPFTYNGQQIGAIPLPEILAIAEEIKKHPPSEDASKLMVTVTTKDCQPDDGTNVPGVNPKSD